MDLGLIHSFIAKRFKQPLVLFQSDDWGLNRCGTAAATEALLGRYPEALRTPMQRLDLLESEEDVMMLKAVLAKGRRVIGGGGAEPEDNAPVFTCNAVMANMDFEESLRVGEFVSEGVVSGYERIHGAGLGGYGALKAGQEEGYFDIQFHGAVHIQYQRLMLAMAEADAHVMAGLELGIMGVSPSNKDRSGRRGNFMAALDWHASEFGYSVLLDQLKQAQLDFKTVWDRPATSFIAPAYIWDAAMEAMLVNGGIDVIQGLPYQLMSDGKGGFKKKYRRMQYDMEGVFYTLRNCYFEPGENYQRDYVASCLGRMKTLIKWGVPVVINTHRFNYMGGMSADHRAHGLRELERLILGIIQQWPEVRFVGTSYFSNNIKH